MSSSAPRARGTYSISKQDMEASRLVFVFVRDAKPKRKVAVPVPDGLTWEEFIQQVKGKLKVSGIKEILLVSTGQKVTSLDELQDIDELCVVEGMEPARPSAAVTMSPTQGVNPPASGSTEITVQSERQMSMTTPNGTMDRSKLAGVSFNTASSSRPDPHDHDRDDNKYTRRVHPLKRLLQKWLPSAFAPTLPVTSRDSMALQTSESAQLPKKRKGRRNVLSMRTLLLVLAIATMVVTMLWVMLRSAPTVN